MVLGPQGPGRVGRCQAGELRKAPFLQGAFLFAEKDWQASFCEKEKLTGDNKIPLWIPGG
jgi:hypothetical protein